MKRSLCDLSMHYWRKHRGPNAKHPYLRSVARPAAERSPAQRMRDRRKAQQALSLLGAVIGSTSRFF